MFNRPHSGQNTKERAALRSLKQDDTIVFLPADKSRATVVSNKCAYRHKLEKLLEDNEVYRKSNYQEVASLIKSINSTVKLLYQRKELSKSEELALKVDSCSIARFYGLPKIHKEGAPLRPIVSLPASPTYSLAKFLWRKLKFLIDGSEYSISCADQALEKLKQVHIEDDEIMISFDVVSLFTSINLDIALDSIKQLLLTKSHNNLSISHEGIEMLFRLCLKTYFRYDDTTYEQIQGTPMGSPVSGLIAEAVMQRLEHMAISKLGPKLWMRYVDDTFVIVKRHKTHDALDVLNNLVPNIRFTNEELENGQLPFLDILIKRSTTGTLKTTVYRKETHTDQILNYASNHPNQHKASCIRTLFTRVNTHCSTHES